MSNISIRFMMVAIAAALIGMCGGIVMAIAQDFSLAPAHAHLNLLGWVTMALYGLFYRAFPEAAQGILPRIHFWLAACGMTLMVPGIGWTVLGHEGGERIIAPGALMVVSGMVAFGIVVVRTNMARPRQRVAATV
jgi:cbb3-type cytochrome oxidase subunit 1